MLIIIFSPLPPSSHFSGSAYCPGRKGKGEKGGGSEPVQVFLSVHYLAVGGREEAGPPPAALAFNGPNRRQRVRIIAGNFLAFLFLLSLFFPCSCPDSTNPFFFFPSFFLYHGRSSFSPGRRKSAGTGFTPPQKKVILRMRIGSLLLHLPIFFLIEFLRNFRGFFRPKVLYVVGRRTSSALPHFPLRTPQVPLYRVAEFYDAVSMTGQAHFFCPLIAWRDACFSWDENPIKPTLMRRGERGSLF